MKLVVISLIFILVDVVEGQVISTAGSTDVSLAYGVTSTEIDSQNVEKMVVKFSWNILKPYISGCHFVLLTQSWRRSFAHHIIKLSFRAHLPALVVDLSTLEGNFQNTHDLIWDGITSTCKILLVDMTFQDYAATLRFLHLTRIWVRPETKIIFVGKKEEFSAIFWSPVFRNTVHILYVGLNDLTYEALQHSRGQICSLGKHLKRCTYYDSHRNYASLQRVTLISRCLFCNNGEAEGKKLGSWPLDSFDIPTGLNLFPYEANSLHGYDIRTVSVPYFRYVEFKLDMTNLSKPSLLEDCLSRRIIDTVSPIMNFTYDVIAPPDLKYGTPLGNGSWTGIVGVIQKEKADMTHMITNSAEKYPIMDLARLVPSDRVVIVTLKPESPPQYFVIIRPFAEEVWMCVAASILIWALSFWLLQNLRSETVGGKRVTFNWAIFHSFAVVLEDPPTTNPTNSVGQMLLGLWLLACLIITTYFRSSLVALLSVQSKTKPVDSFEDLISLNLDWNWGIDETLLGAQPKLYFTNDKDPVIKEVYRRSESITVEEALAKVMSGNYAFMVTNNRLSYFAALNYMDDRGQTPFYISKTSYTVASDFGWGFRKGFPYLSRFSQMLDRLTDAGLMNYWLEDVLNSEFRSIRRRNREKRDPSEALKYSKLELDENEIVVTTRHMIGVYLTVLLGFLLSLGAFFMEIIVSKFHLTKSSSGGLHNHDPIFG